MTIAGRYAAWIECQRLGYGHPLAPGAVVVYDLRAGKVAYRLDPRTLAPAFVLGIALRADGTVAFISDPSPGGGCSGAGDSGGVGWASAAEPRPHFLVGNARGENIELADDRIIYVMSPTCQVGVTPTFRLVAASLDGTERWSSPIACCGFDADGSRIVYLADARHIVSSTHR